MAIEMSSGFCACSGPRETNKPGRCVPPLSTLAYEVGQYGGDGGGSGCCQPALKGAVINIFTMPYAAHCPSVLTLHTHTQSLMNKATHQPAQTLLAA